MRQVANKTGSKQGYDRRCRNLSPAEIEAKESAGMPFVIRLKVPLSGECVYEDKIKGLNSNLNSNFFSILSQGS